MKALALCLVALTSGSEIKLTAANYDTIVTNSDEAFMVEFSSKMCGSCKEFAPEWESLSQSLKRIKTAHVYIDDADGQKIAEKLGVLEAGIPNVQLYTTSQPKTIMAGEVKTSKFLRKKIAPLVKGLKKRDSDGVFIKKGKGAPAPELVADEDGMYKLTDANWDDALAKHNYVVKFFAPWCSMCKKLKPFWDKAPALVPDENIRFATIDATKEMKMANKYSINKYPTIKAIGISKTTGEELAVDFELKKMKGDGKETEFLANWGQKKAADIDKSHATMLAIQKHEKEQIEKQEQDQEDEAAKNDENVVKRITKNNFVQLREKYTSKPDQQLFVKFYRPDCKTCQKLAPRFEGAAGHMLKVEKKPEIAFAHVDCVLYHKVCQDEGIPSYPLMIRYNMENMKGEWPGDIYEKSSSVKEMVEFVGGDKSKIDAETLNLDTEIDIEIAAAVAAAAAKKDGGKADPSNDEL